MARGFWRGVIAVACLLLVACGSQSPSDTIETEQQTIASWAATAQAVGEAWGRGDVPSPYTRQTLQTAREEWQKSAKSLREARAAGGDAERGAGVLIGAIGQLDAATGQLLDAVARDDRAATGPPVARLAALAGVVASAR